MIGTTIIFIFLIFVQCKTLKTINLFLNSRNFTQDHFKKSSLLHFSLKLIYVLLVLYRTFLCSFIIISKFIIVTDWAIREFKKKLFYLHRSRGKSFTQIKFIMVQSIRYKWTVVKRLFSSSYACVICFELKSISRNAISCTLPI